LTGKLRTWLCPSSDLDHERSSLRSKRCENTGDWIFEKKEYKTWRTCETSSLLWLHARPGAGKSVLAAHLIENLDVSGQPFGYFFFKYNNSTLSSPKDLLRTICFQLAVKHSAVYDIMVGLMESGFDVQKGRIGTLWQQLFSDRILQLRWPKPMFWVVDGLDECNQEERGGFIQLLADLAHSPLHVKMIILSRRAKDISHFISQLPFQVDEICPEDNLADIMTYARRRLRGSTIGSQATLKESILDKIEKSASGTFLWVQTALDQLDQQDTVDGIIESLNSLPQEMNSYYLRILKSIPTNILPSTLGLAHAIFEWITVAARPLHVQELQAPLNAEFGELLDINASIANHCGGLISTDASGRIEAIHMTVNEFLLLPSNEHKFSVHSGEANARVATFCFETLVSSSFGQLDLTKELSKELFAINPFAQYAVEFCFHHLNIASATPDLTEKLRVFWTSKYLICWIKCLGHLGHLDLLLPSLKSVDIYMDQVDQSQKSTFLRMATIAQEMRYFVNTLGFTTYLSYEGDILKGKRHGYGTSKSLDGGTHIGNWLNDMPDGFGSCTYSGLSRYTGGWKENEWNGEGQFDDPEGNSYKGSYVMGKRQGFGIMKWSWGDRFAYTGQWMSDRCHGTGEMKFADGGFYIGQWQRGLMHGTGRLQKWNDDFYNGEFVEGAPLGPFTPGKPTKEDLENPKMPSDSETSPEVFLEYSTGSTYKGSVKGDRPHGKGELHSCTGMIWKGIFADGMMHGPGASEWPHGGYSKGSRKADQADGYTVELNDSPEHLCKFKGFYNMGVREGEGELWRPNGFHYKGNFHISEMHGEGVRTRVVGHGRYEGEFKDGLENGRGKIYMPGGAVQEGTWKSRKRHGEDSVLTFVDGSTYRGVWRQGSTRQGEFLFIKTAKGVDDLLEFDEEGNIGHHGGS
jgi:hypothetical protein